MINFRLDGKRALIGGGSSGIGLGIARGFLEAGASVVLAARNEEKLTAAKTKLDKEFGKTEKAVDVTSFDVHDVEGVGNWYAELVEKHGGFDLLVTCAATTHRARADELTLDQWREVMDVNLNSVFAMCQAFGKERIASGQKGKIINIASLMTSATRPGTSAYTATKGGIGQLTKSLALDWARSGIQVNAIAPGYVATPLTQALQDDAEFTHWVESRCPLGRWATPADMAGPAVFLASDASDFMTGQTIYVDGGWLCGL